MYMHATEATVVIVYLAISFGIVDDASRHVPFGPVPTMHIINELAHWRNVCSGCVTPRELAQAHPNY